MIIGWNFDKKLLFDIEVKELKNFIVGEKINWIYFGKKNSFIGECVYFVIV